MFPTRPYNIETTLNFVFLTVKLLYNQGKETAAETIIKQSLDILGQKYALFLQEFLDKIIHIYFNAAQYEKAEVYCARFFESFHFSDNENSSDRDVILGLTYLWSGKNEKAYECFQKNLGNIVETGNCFLMRNIYSDLGEVCLHLGRFEEAVDYFEKCLIISLDLGDRSCERSCHRNLALCYTSLGQYNLSVSCSEKALSLSVEIGDRSGEGHDYENLGNACNFLGQYEKAVECCKKALEGQLEEEDCLGQGSAYRCLGTVYISMEQFRNAKECFEKCLDIGVERNHRSLKLSGYQNLAMVYSCFWQRHKAIESYECISLELGNQSEIGGSYVCPADVYGNERNYDKAIEYYQKCLDVCSESGLHEAEGSCYYGLGLVYNMLGKCDEARKYLEKYLKICQETGDSINYCFLGLGHVFMNKGQFEKAEEFSQRSLAISVEIGDKLVEAKGYAQLGCISSLVGEYRKGVEYAKKGISICLEIDYRMGEASNHGVLGTLYSHLRQFEKAISHCNKSLVIQLEIGDGFGEGGNYATLADVCRRLGDYKEALRYDTMSHDVFASIGSQSGVVKQCEFLGENYLYLGQPHKAIECCEKGIAIAQEIKTPLAWLYGVLGWAYDGAKQFDKAEVFLKKAIKEGDAYVTELYADRRKTWVSRDYYSIHTLLSSTCFRLGKIHEAFLVLDLGKAKALQILLEQRRESKGEKEVDDLHRKETWRQIEDGKEEQRLKEIARDVQLRENNSTVLLYNFFTHTKELFIWVLNADGELSLRFWKPNDEELPAEDWLYKATERLLSTVSVQLRRDCSFFSSLPWLPLPPGFEDDALLSCLQRIGRPRDSKVKESVDTSSDAEVCNTSSSDMKFPSVVSSSDHAATAAKDLSSAGVLPGNDAAFGVTNEVLSQAHGKITEENAENLPADSKSSDSEDSVSSWYSTPLYSALIEPVADLIKGTKLIIVPDKILFFTPFSMLMGKQGHYLSQRYSIQVTPSLHTLALSKQVPRSDTLGPALFVGNPTVGEVLLYDRPTNVPPLPYATIEARALASRFNARPLVNDKATKDRVLECIDNASIIHIAAHGLEDNGEILLAPNAQVKKAEQLPTERSYLLTQRDAINRRLRAQLVVLCCCHTGRGEPTSEGVLGIARSFLGAGARSVLVALWALPDFETKVFMEHFYDEICEERSSCEALQKTMTMFQKSRNIKHQSFRTWAPFTIIGEDTRFTKADIEEIRNCSRSTVN